MQDIAIASPNRYLIKVEDFFTTTAFLQNAANLTEYPLLIVVRRGIEPLYRELPVATTFHRNPTDLLSKLTMYSSFRAVNHPCAIPLTLLWLGRIL